MSYSTLRLYTYERRKRFLTYALEFYVAFIFCINFFVPFLIKLSSNISLHKTFFTFNDMTYFRIFSQQQSALIEHKTAIWPLISNIFTMMYIDAFMMFILGALLTYQYTTYRNNRKLMVYEVMAIIVCIQLLSAILGVMPFIALKTVAYAIGLIVGHSLSDTLKTFTNPLHAPTTLKKFFYIVEEHDEKKEKSS